MTYKVFIYILIIPSAAFNILRVSKNANEATSRTVVLQEGPSIRMDKQTNGKKDERTVNLPILQDFVPYRGRCPASIE